MNQGNLSKPAADRTTDVGADLTEGSDALLGAYYAVLPLDQDNSLRNLSPITLGNWSPLA